jgi:hypothetical protein
VLNCHQTVTKTLGSLSKALGDLLRWQRLCDDFLASTTCAGLTIRCRRNTLAVLWPLIFMATFSPALTKLRTAGLRRTWTMSPS